MAQIVYTKYLFATIIKEWVVIRDLANLDVAFSSHMLRPLFLSIISLPELCYEGGIAEMLRCGGMAASKSLFYRWVFDRNVHIEALVVNLFSEDVVDESILWSIIARNVRELYLGEMVYWDGQCGTVASLSALGGEAMGHVSQSVRKLKIDGRAIFGSTAAETVEYVLQRFPELTELDFGGLECPASSLLGLSVACPCLSALRVRLVAESEDEVRAVARLWQPADFNGIVCE
jgi:hypothetical protein